MGKRKKYVTYHQVIEGLHRYWCNSPSECDPKNYIQTLREETGLSYSKIAHDLRADSGTDVTDQTVYNWGKA